MKRRIKGAQIVLEVLKRMGVKDIFGYPGGAVIPIYDALYDDQEINHYLVRHEQGASHMADAYARVKSGSVGVCLATSGPGATNLVTGIMTAYMDSIPLLAITGQVGSSYLGKDSFQESHVLGITSPITKHNYLVGSIEELPRILKEAYRLTRVGRHGPVLVDIPKDVQMDSISYERFEEIYREENLYLEEKYSISVKDGSVEEFVKMLREAKKPIIVAGGGVVRSGAVRELQDVLERSGVPSVSTLMGLGSVAEGTPGYLGMIGMHGSKRANTCVDECDLFISLGMRFDDRIVGDATRFAPHAKKIHVDIDEAEINKSVKTDLAIVGDAREVLVKVLEHRNLGNHKSWRRKWEDGSEERSGREEILSKKVLRYLSEIMPEDTIITTDVGQHQMFTAQTYGFKREHTLCTSGGAGTMGYGLPAAIGAQVAKPNSRVVAISGDGGFQMNQQELMLLIQYKLPVKVFIFNNSSLGMVRQWQELFNERRFSHVELEYNPDFLTLGRAYGLRGRRVESVEELREIHVELLDDEPLIVEVVVPRGDNVYPIIPAGRSVRETIEGVRDEEAKYSNHNEG